jgi:hexulose-6-phosphate isomerase
MQGRMSPLVDGQVQAFPKDHWRDEFLLGNKHDIRMMEWTLDYKGLHENPLLTSEGQQEIKRLSGEYSVSIPSLTGDCFMQVPFWKASKVQQESLERDFLAVVDAFSIMGIKYMVVPLVDNGSLGTTQEEEVLVEFMERQIEIFQEKAVIIVFESDFEPPELKRFISQFPIGIFGVNYDTGNSASLGYQFQDEFEAYGDRILNVHLKDRLLGGTTVPLGVGNAKLPETISALERQGYQGNYILQTARAVDGDHVGAICHYRDMVKDWAGQN